MKTIKYEGRTFRVPETINGKKLREALGIPKERAVYTELDGKNKLVSDGDKLYIREGEHIGSLPHTEKG